MAGMKFSSWSRRLSIAAWGLLIAGFGLLAYGALTGGGDNTDSETEVADSATPATGDPADNPDETTTTGQPPAELARAAEAALAKLDKPGAVDSGEPFGLVDGEVNRRLANATIPPFLVGSRDSAPLELPDVDAVYSQDIEPILESTCASCHTTGQAGASALLLNNAGEAVAEAEFISRVTHAQVMPPWPASNESVEFAGNYSLSAEEIALIVDWADKGAPLDVPASTPIESSRPTSYLEDPDLVLTSTYGAYEGSADVEDDYRCLIFDAGVTEQEWVLASHFVPDQTEVVHHGIITLASAGLREQADALDAEDEKPGWTCYGGSGLEGGTDGFERRMGGWAPGAQPNRRPEGYAIPINPDDFFVVQIHYHYNDAAPADLTEFHLDLASDEQIAAQGGAYAALRSALYLGPAEIPCYDDDTNPLCDRDVALQRVIDLYGSRVGSFSNFFLFACESSVDDYTEMTDGTAWSTCDLDVVNPGRIVTVAGHMHELGMGIRLTLNPDTPEEKILLDIPKWDFEWQLGYSPVDEIIIDANDTIRVDCAWNRELAPYDPVGYVLWADGTGDEMCYSSITTAPVN